MSQYAKALEAVREASRKFRIAQESYRQRWIGDAEFLAAKAAHDEASKIFDAAYADEEARMEGP